MTTTAPRSVAYGYSANRNSIRIRWRRCSSQPAMKRSPTFGMKGAKPSNSSGVGRMRRDGRCKLFCCIKSGGNGGGEGGAWVTTRTGARTSPTSVMLGTNAHEFRHCSLNDCNAPRLWLRPWMQRLLLPGDAGLAEDDRSGSWDTWDGGCHKTGGQRTQNAVPASWWAPAHSTQIDAATRARLRGTCSTRIA